MYTFSKEERLTEKKIIQHLFDNGNEFFVPPFRVLYEYYPSVKPFTVKLLIAVSNRNFKKAVERNRIKRLVRESYRKNKDLLLRTGVNKSGTITLILQYTGKTLPSYKETVEKIILILQRLLKIHEKNSG